MKKIVIASVVSILSITSIQANAFGMKESIEDKLNLNEDQRRILEDDMKERINEMNKRRKELKIKLNLNQEQSETFDKIFEKRHDRFKKFEHKNEKTNNSENIEG